MNPFGVASLLLYLLFVVVSAGSLLATSNSSSFLSLDHQVHFVLFINLDGPDHFLPLFILRNEHEDYQVQIIKYCWIFRMKISIGKCRELMIEAATIVNMDRIRSWTDDYCLISGLNERKCFITFKSRYVGRPSGFKIPFQDMILKIQPSNFFFGVEDHFNMMKEIAIFLTDQSCHHDNVIPPAHFFFTEEQRLLWQHPFHGVWRKTDAVGFVPCEDAQYWVQQGTRWAGYPMWAAETKEYSLLKCTSRENILTLDSNTCSVDDGLRHKCTLSWNILCSDFWPFKKKKVQTKSSVLDQYQQQEEEGTPDCFVFSVTSSYLLHDQSFEEDIIRNYNCFIYYFNNNSDIYIHNLRHNITQIDLLKLNTGNEDDLGSAFRTLVNFVNNFPSVNVPICNININILLPSIENTEFEVYNFMVQLALFFELYIEINKFKLWFRHANPLRRRNCIVHPIFVQLGFPEHICAYDIGLHNLKCAKANDNNVDLKRVIKRGTVPYIDTFLSIPIKIKTAKSAAAAAAAAAVPITTTTTATICCSCAVVQFEESMHSELIGPLINLCLSAGFSNVIVYFDFINSTSSISASTNSIISIFEGWESWDIRPTDIVFDEADQWDLLVLATGDEVYKQLLDISENVHFYQHKILAIQHHHSWVVPDILPHYLFLTPHKDKNWIFPLIKAKQDMIVKINNNGFISDRKTLLLLGHIEFEVNNFLKKTKDVEDMCRFLLQDASSNFLILIARSVGAFGEVSEKFQNQTLVLSKLVISEYVDILNSFTFLWIPIPKKSLFMKGVFTSSLAIGVAFKKTMIMPRHLSEFYGLSGAVVEYENSITEIDLDNIDHVEIQRKLGLWEYARSVQNTINFMEAISFLQTTSSQSQSTSPLSLFLPQIIAPLLGNIQRPIINILYVSFHEGTRLNFDAIAAYNHWNVTHIRPANGYLINRRLAKDVWKNSYKPILDASEHAFTHVIICDTIAAGAYSFLMHAHEIKNISIILQVTNYFDYLNHENKQLLDDFRLLARHKNVQLISVDQFVNFYLRYRGVTVRSGHFHYIPNSGTVIQHRNPVLDVRLSQLALDEHNVTFYYDLAPPFQSVNKVCSTYRVHCQQMITLYALKGIDVYPHRGFGGPSALQNYVAVVYNSYIYSTMSLQEYLSIGLIVFVQSKEMTVLCSPDLVVDLMDVYTGPLSHMVEYFSSYEELQEMVFSLQEHNDEYYEARKRERINFMAKYDESLFKNWAAVVESNLTHILINASKNMKSLEEYYESAKNTVSDIFEHIPLLKNYASQCESILELGVSFPVSTWAMLLGLKHNSFSIKRLFSSDIMRHVDVDDCDDVAAVNNIEFEFRLGSDLELDLTQSFDMTFIDTLHVYGQLKRELAKFSPITNKWIIMHDTEIDAEMGESLRDNHDIPQLSRETGIPEVEFQKGLAFAIEEFLAEHLEWELELVKKNNNGLTVLRRRSVRSMFIITSIIDLPAPTLYNVILPQVRFQQTIHTVESVRRHVPSAVVIILDGSIESHLIPGADFHFHYSDSVLLRHVPKSIGETMLLEEFMRSLLFNQLKLETDVVFKLSGRYYLNENFQFSRFSTSRFTACKTYDEDRFGSFNPNPDKSAYNTVLFSFPVIFSDQFISRLLFARNRMFKVGGNIEQNIFFGLDLDMIVNLDPIGVEGIQAPTLLHTIM